MRGCRRALPIRVQRLHARQAGRIYRRSPLFLRYRRIGLYIANDGELDPAPIAACALAAGKRLYLPVLRRFPGGSLWFSDYPPGARLRNNRFGIPEPDLRTHPPLPPWGLDVVLMPLVSFDASGNRLGMGGGFYDRTLAYLHHRRCWRRPLLIGLAHECQRSRQLPRRPWDIPLDGVLTENGLTWFGR